MGPGGTRPEGRAPGHRAGGAWGAAAPPSPARACAPRFGRLVLLISSENPLQLRDSLSWVLGIQEFVPGYLLGKGFLLLIFEAQLPIT